MKNKLRFLALLGTSLGIAIFIIAAGKLNAADSENLKTGVPTLAPTPTPGEPSHEWQPSASSVDLPLLTSDQALEMALRVNQVWSIWDQPWSKNTLNSETGRIKVELFPSRTAESAEAGREEGFAPEAEAEAGAVWRVTLKGEVRVNTPSMQAAPRDIKYDGVTYVISQKTRKLLAVITGRPKK